MLYNLAFLVFSVFYLPSLIFKGKMRGDFAQRLAKYDTDTRMRLAAAKSTIWIQAVSVGEVALCRSLIPELGKLFPGHTVVLSTVTKTGQDLAKRLFAGVAVIIYFPLDLSFIARKAVEAIKPAVYVMVETEIWPNVIAQCVNYGARCLMINGRISDRSYGKYLLARPFLKNTLARISSYCMQSGTDAKRVVSMGADPKRVEVTGSMKFDAAASCGSDAQRSLADKLGIGEFDKLIVAGSTHKGEEEIVLGAFAGLVKNIPGLKLLIAPRHIERAAEIESLVKRYGFIPARVSALSGSSGAVSAPAVFILDTIGDLNGAYALATLVFIGGSLVPHGGQNPIEPAAMGKAVVFGPHMFNFRDIAASMTENLSAVMINESSEMPAIFEILLRDKDKRTVLGQKARQYILGRRGATAMNVRKIAEYL